MKYEHGQVTITCAELLELQLANLKEFFQEDFICILLQELAYKHQLPRKFPISSEHVIEQIKKAMPSRFFKHAVDSCILDDHLLAKYGKVKNPRICLLRAIPLNYEFKFQMK